MAYRITTDLWALGLFRALLSPSTAWPLTRPKYRPIVVDVIKNSLLFVGVSALVITERQFEILQCQRTFQICGCAGDHDFIVIFVIGDAVATPFTTRLFREPGGRVRDWRCFRSWVESIVNHALESNVIIVVAVPASPKLENDG